MKRKFKPLPKELCRCQVFCIEDLNRTGRYCKLEAKGLRGATATMGGDAKGDDAVHVGGFVIVKPLAEWHKLADPRGEADSPSSPPDAVLEALEEVATEIRAVRVPSKRAGDQLHDIDRIMSNALSRYRGKEPHG